MSSVKSQKKNQALNPGGLVPKPGDLPTQPPPSAPISSCSPEFDVEGSDAQLLAPLGYILGSQHGSIWRGLISISLHLHPTSHTADSFSENKSTRSLLSHSTRFSVLIKS